MKYHIFLLLTFSTTAFAGWFDWLYDLWYDDFSTYSIEKLRQSFPTNSKLEEAYLHGIKNEPSYKATYCPDFEQVEYTLRTADGFRADPTSRAIIAAFGIGEINRMTFTYYLNSGSCGTISVTRDADERGVYSWREPIYVPRYDKLGRDSDIRYGVGITPAETKLDAYEALNKAKEYPPLVTNGFTKVSLFRRTVARESEKRATYLFQTAGNVPGRNGDMVMVDAETGAWMKGYWGAL